MQREAKDQLTQGHKPPGDKETGRMEETAGQVRPGRCLQEQIRTVLIVAPGCVVT